ncbi:MAG: hypothetical protein DME25_07885 [Verrucomicrobia bacterium]|nr:MAG: hypothetical protein DME25_07885 [Verrucomicrobiota bacterium]
MRKGLFQCALAALVLAGAESGGQTTNIYDQQSYDHAIPANVLYGIQQFQPIGQSFTPTLPSIGFVQFDLYDDRSLNGLGATLYVNLRANSITGAVVSSTTPVFLPDDSFGVVSFLFPTPAPLAPGTTYYLEPVVQSGDLWLVNGGGNPYPRGTAFIRGADIGEDLWFREGIIVPEPSAAWLTLVGVGVSLYASRRFNPKAVPHAAYAVARGSPAGSGRTVRRAYRMREIP